MLTAFETKPHRCSCKVVPPEDKALQHVALTPYGWVCNVCHAIIDKSEKCDPFRRKAVERSDG